MQYATSSFGCVSLRHHPSWEDSWWTHREEAMPDRLIHWLVEDLTWGGVLFGASLFLVTIIGSLLVVGFLVVKLPAPTTASPVTPGAWTWASRASGELVSAADATEFFGPACGQDTVSAATAARHPGPASAGGRAHPAPTKPPPRPGT